jgi:drug/metabolite transporter (DMT)-like permease
MLFFSAYLAFSRKNRHAGSIWMYIVPLYLIAGMFCLLVSFLFANPIKAYSLREIRLFLALGLIPTVIGHSILNYSMKTLRGQLVSLVNMGQFIFAGIMAFLLWREIPSFSFYLASLLIVVGAMTALKAVEVDR